MGDGIVINLVANAIWLAIGVGGRWLLKRERGRNPLRRGWYVAALELSTLFVLAAGLSVLALVDGPDAAGWVLVAVAALWLLLLPLSDMWTLWRVGVHGADLSVSAGISYPEALKLCRNEMSFLGTGARKLSRTPEFEQALRRCRSDVPIRLLLRKPDDATLVKAAQRAGKPDDSYRTEVVESLREIAKLKKSIEAISVRFYENDLVFRVMIVDRRIALVSYNIYGEGDGSQLPQLHLCDVSYRRRTVQSFYHAFERYFNEQWDRAVDWDFQEFI